MNTQAIDYEALAKQHGAIGYTPAAKPIAGGKMDYTALAKQHGAISSQPAATPAPNPYQQAAERIPGGTGTSMSAGPPAPTPEQPGFFSRLIHAAGIPTSQEETTTAMQSMLMPQPEPGAEGLLKFEESLPVLGADFRARAQLARQGRPTSMIPFLGPAIAQFTESTVGEHPDVATGLGAGVNVAGQTLGLRSLLTPKPPMPEVPVRPPAGTVAPAHVEALTGLIEDRGGTVDPHVTATEALPHLRETAVRMGVDPAKLSGREAGQTTLRVAEQAVRDTQNEFNTIRKPYNAVLVDQSPIAAAYRSAITPELLANEPRVAAALERSAKKFDQPAPLEQVNQFRVRMNNQLNAFEQRGTTAQIMSDIETKAQHAATNAARDIEYSTVGRLSGLDPEYIRALKQREGSLIEAKSSLTKEYNRASGAQGESVSESMREKLTSTFPSKHGVQKSILKNVIGPKPIDVLNSRIQKMFAGMGGASELPEYTQVQPPAEPLPVEAGPSGPVSGEPATSEAMAAMQRFHENNPGTNITVTPKSFMKTSGPIRQPVAPTAEDAISEATRRGPGTDPEAVATRERQAEFLKTKRENLAGQRKEVPQKAVDIRKELERPAPPAPATVTGGQITPEHVASENAFYTQARAELGADASPSAVLQRAQALKIEHTAKSTPPPATPVPPTVRPTLTPPRGPVPYETWRAANFTKGTHGWEDSAGNIYTDERLHQMHENGEQPFAVPRARANITLTQKMQAQPTPTLRRVNTPTRPSPVGEITPAGTPQQQATALMLMVKSGQLSPAEADSRIKRLVGTKARRTIRRPARPE